MANTDPEALKAAQLAYERSNVSLKDYNPHQLEDADKVGEVERAHPAEPVLARAEDSGLVAAAQGEEKPAAKPAAK
jgi:hypothetical protein